MSDVPGGAPFLFYFRCLGGTQCRLRAHRSGVAMHVLTDCGCPGRLKCACEAASRKASYFLLCEGGGGHRVHTCWLLAHCWIRFLVRPAGVASTLLRLSPLVHGTYPR